MRSGVGLGFWAASSVTEVGAEARAAVSAAGEGGVDGFGGGLVSCTCGIGLAIELSDMSLLRGAVGGLARGYG